MGCGKTHWGKLISEKLKIPFFDLDEQIVASEGKSINDIFADGLVPIIADLLSIICVLAYMFWVDWQLTFIALIPFPVMILANYYFKESINVCFFKVRNAVASLNGFVQEHLTGMQVVQAFASEKREFEKFKKINQQHRNANINAIFAYSIFFPIVEIVLALAMGLIVWWVAKETLGGDDQTGKILSFILSVPSNIL